MKDGPDDGIPLRQRRAFSPLECTHSQDGQKCRRKHCAKGYCRTHYMRAYRNRGDAGQVDILPRKTIKMTHARALTVVRLIRDGTWDIPQAAEHYGVSQNTIKDILNGRTWSAVTRGDVASS